MLLFRKRRIVLSAQGAVALGFAALIVFSAALLMLPVSSSAHTWTDPLTALFTAVSAVCVTGLTVVDTAYGADAFVDALLGI